MGHYKRGNGHIQMRRGNGQFRRATLEDMGVYNGNKDCTVYICNVCEREFIPLLHSGKCCGVDNKRVKEIILTEAQLEIQSKIEAIRKKPFINRLDLQQIEQLQCEYNRLPKP